MREIITNLALFVVFCIAFSSFTACTGTQSNTANVSNASNANAASTAANTNSQTFDTKASDTKTSVYPALAAGLADADFELLDGSKIKVSERKGKVLLLNIWGTWCGPCRAEMPTLIGFQQQYGDRGFEVIGLNIGDGNGTPESVEDIKRFVDQMKLNYTIARSSNASTNQFYAITKQQVIPQSILVDRDGHLRGVFIGGGQRIFDSMKETIDKVMSE